MKHIYKAWQDIQAMSYPDKYPEYLEMPDVPTSMKEATYATEKLHEQLRAVKRVMEAHRLAPGHWDERWEIPFNDGQLYAAITRMIVEIQTIKNLLIVHGLASENDMVPLTPRWRIDGHKQHYRNVQIFEQCVRLIIKQESEGLPEGSFSGVVDKLLGQNKDGKVVK